MTAAATLVLWALIVGAAVLVWLVIAVVVAFLFAGSIRVRNRQAPRDDAERAAP